MASLVILTLRESYLRYTYVVPTNATMLVTHCESSRDFIPLLSKILTLQDSSVVW